MAIDPVTSLLRIRVIKRFDAGNAEVTNDLPHLHTSTFSTAGMQPGNPSSASDGSFTINLFPPGSEQYATNFALYQKLAKYQRVEFYASHDGASLGKLVFAGPITGIDYEYGASSHFTLTGESDLTYANLSHPFPGELLSNDVTSAILKNYLGTNELGFADTMASFTIGNYTSTNEPTNTSGTWSQSTDDGFPIVFCNTGTGAVLISKTGAIANDRWNSHFVEVTGRLNPTADVSNAGQMGVGITKSTANINDSVQGRLTSRVQGGRRNFDVALVVYAAGVPTIAYTVTNALVAVDDPTGYIPVTLGLLVSTGGNVLPGTQQATVTVNGKVIISNYSGIGYDPSTVTNYPFIRFGIASSGTASVNLMNLIQMTRFTTDGASTAALFGNGTITTTTTQIGWGIDPGANFLDAWGRLATRDSFYWRYNPKPYVIGTRTLGTIDYSADPGTDLGTNQKIVFSRAAGNLTGCRLSENADSFATGTAASGQPTVDGGGIGYWRDIASMTANGVLEDESLAMAASDFQTLRKKSFRIMSNKISTGGNLGSKTITVLRDPQTADLWRELDKVMIDDPEMGLNKVVARVLAYTFTEGSPEQTLTLDQFSWDWAGE